MIRILLVDDQKTFRESLRVWLEPVVDLEIVGTASDGYSAIEQVGKLHPDLVLIDLEMPGLDGIATTRIICEQFTRVKVIVLSVHDEAYYLDQAIKAGATGYLIKVPPLDELIAVIRFVHRGYAQIGPGLLNQTLSQIPEFNLNLLPTKTSESRKPKPSEISAIRSSVKTVNLANFETGFSLRRFHRSRKSYLAIWLIGNTLLWTAALAYLILKAPTYKSEWAISLPTGSSSTNVNLPEIANASSQSDSPFSNSDVSDPRENYKFLAETTEVREAAASQLYIPIGELGKPQINIVDNTTLMKFEIEGETPQKAYKKALALQDALEARLDRLREQEIEQQDWKLQATLDSSKKQLQKAQQRLSKYKTLAPVSSREQMQNLSTNIENLRLQKAETLAELKQIDASLQELSVNLGLSAREAADAFVLQSDPLFQQYLSDYSRINGELVNLESKFLSANPIVIDKQAEKNEVLSSLVQRGQSLLNRSVSQSFLERLSLNSSSSDGSKRAVLFQELISQQTQQKGLQDRARELEQQIKNLENRLSSLSPQESNLANLQRDVQIAEAVFSSTMTKLDLSKSDIFASYPRIQIVSKPSIPDEPSSLKSNFVLLGSFMGSFFLTTGLFSLWWRDRQNRQAQKEEKLELNLLPSFNHSNNSVASKK
ncbi:MAG TPA: response regulator [Coleofasciculaceae cyanobacterium]